VTVPDWDKLYDTMSDEELRRSTPEPLGDPCLMCGGTGRIAPPDSVIKQVCMACLGNGQNWRQNGKNH
jgi:hypothetical protein